MDKYFDPDCAFWRPFGLLANVLLLSFVLIVSFFTLFAFGPTLTALFSGVGSRSFFFEIKRNFRKTAFLGLFYLLFLWLLLDLWPRFLLLHASGQSLALLTGVLFVCSVVLQAIFLLAFYCVAQGSKLKRVLKDSLLMVLKNPLHPFLAGFVVQLGWHLLLSKWYFFWPLLLLPGLSYGLAAKLLQQNVRALA